MSKMILHKMLKSILVKQAILLATVTCLAVAGYLLASKFIHSIGFPLDDAWIHQTYARNLAELGQWSFIPASCQPGRLPRCGQCSSRSGISFPRAIPYAWTYCLGGLSLLGIGLAGEVYLSRQLPDLTTRVPGWNFLDRGMAPGVGVSLRNGNCFLLPVYFVGALGGFRKAACFLVGRVAGRYFSLDQAGWDYAAWPDPLRAFPVYGCLDDEICQPG